MADILRAIRELERRRALPELLTACFDKQVSFINDNSKRKALFVARRSGKTWAIAVDLIKSCLEAPVTKCLYYGLTRESAWNTIFLHMLEPLCRQFHIPVEVNRSYQTMTFENKSFIKITGDDSSNNQIDRALGGKYGKVVLDECQSVKHDLEDWVKNKLGPAMVDLDGAILLAGTAGPHMGERFWYKVTKTDGIREPGWSVHSWTPFDNPYVEKNVKTLFAQKRAENADYESDPGFRQQWLCEWVIDTEERIYRYNPAKNGIDHKDFDSKLWRYVLAIDFGFEDDTAIVAGGFHPHDSHCYIVESWKDKHVQTEDLAEILKAWQVKYRPMQIVGDCQNKQLVEQLRHQYKIPILSADKLGKEAHIAAMNSDFRRGHLQVVVPNNRALIKEWDALVWDEKKRLLGVFKENPTCDNHLADAALYLHHASRHYFAVPAPMDDPSPMRTQAEAELRNMLAQKDDGMDIYRHLERVV